MIAQILMGLLKANLAAGVAILPVLAIRRLVRPRFGAQATYLLWLAPLAAGLAVLAPHPAMRTLASPIAIGATAVADAFVAGAPASLAQGPDLASLAFGLWLAGAVAALGLLFRRQAAFLAALGKLAPADAAGVSRAEHAGVGPALVGVLRPRIVAPADFESRFGADERELILAHERVHLSRGDAAVNALACAAQCLCWFNPLVHLAARLLRIDQELACDATVIDRFPTARRTYAELLLKTQLAAQPLPLGCHWPAGAAHPLKQRIAMLKSPLPARSMRATGLAVAGLLSLGAGGLAWAAQPGPGAAQRLAAEAQNAAHPNYTCDRALELSGGGCKIVNVPTWRALPTHEDLLRLYPAAALKAGVTAQVGIRCGVTATGFYKDCAAVETTVRAPDGVTVTDETRAAFGKAAVALSRYYQARLLEPVPQQWYGHAVAMVVFSPDAIPGSPPRPGAVPAPDLPPLPPASASAAAPPARKVLAAFAPPAAPHSNPAPSGQAAQTPEAALAAFLRSPNWSRRPTAQDLVQTYPPEAVKAKVEGDVLLHCHVTAAGKLADCGVLRETPQGAGFGAAALKLTPLFEAREQAPAGGPKRGSDIRIPIRFRLATPPPAPAH